MTATLLKILADFDTQLTAPVAIGDTTANLYSINDDDGVSLPAGSYCFTIDNSSSSKEYIVGTLSGSALSAISSISRQGVVTSGFARAHRRGAKVTITDWAILKRIANLLDGTTGWDSAVKIGYDADPGLISSDLTKLATIKFVVDTASSGAANASTTVKGIVETATQAEVDARTTTGSTGAELFTRPDTLRATKFFDPLASTGSANAYVLTVVPAATAYSTGQVFSFIANFANTTAATINVSALGAKTIKKEGGATDLAANDIVNGQSVQVIYDGTNMQMVSPIGNAPAKIINDYQSFTGNGTWTKLSGLTGNEMVVVQCWGGGGAGGGATGGSSSGSGGGGGAFLQMTFRASDLGATETVTVGTGGTGVAGATGNTGGTTTFGTLVTAAGGAGGTVGSTPVGATGGASGAGLGTQIYAGGAGTTGVGDKSMYGGSGGGAGAGTGGAGSAGAAAVFGGAGGGGGSVLGAGGAGGAAGVYTGAGGAGSTGVGNGAAAAGIASGGGGAARNSAGTQTGGAGTRGEVRVWTIHNATIS